MEEIRKAVLRVYLIYALSVVAVAVATLWALQGEIDRRGAALVSAVLR